MADESPLINRTLFKYIRNGCIECQQITKLLVQQTPKSPKSNLDRFLSQIDIYYDSLSGKFHFSREICRNPPPQELKKQQIYLDSWDTLNLEKSNSPVWDIHITKPKRTSKLESSFNPEPLFSNQKKQDLNFFSSIWEQITIFTTNLFKREKVCLQCSKHGNYVFPFTSKASMLKKFLQLVHGPSTERNFRENVCKIPTDSRRKMKIKNKKGRDTRKYHFKTNKFSKSTPRNVSFMKLSFDEQPTTVIPNNNNSNNTAHNISNNSIKLPDVLSITSKDSKMNISSEKWWIFFALATKGSCKPKINTLLLDIEKVPSKNITTTVLRIVPPSSPQRNNYTNPKNNWWVLMPLYAKLKSYNTSNLRRVVFKESRPYLKASYYNGSSATSRNFTLSDEEVYRSGNNSSMMTSQSSKLPETVESPTVLATGRDSFHLNKNKASLHHPYNSIQAPSANRLKARLLIDDWNHRYYGGIVKIHIFLMNQITVDSC